MDKIIQLLLQYKYLILFPLAIAEGPVIAVLAGFLCVGGFLNAFIVLPILVFGDMIGDSFCYMLGRWGVPVFIKNILKKFGLNAEKVRRVKVYFDANPAKTISLSKITPGIGVAGIYLAGHAKINYKTFFKICLITSFLQFIVYLCIGLLFGKAYIKISHYLDVAATTIILSALVVMVFLFIKSMLKKL